MICKIYQREYCLKRKYTYKPMVWGDYASINYLKAHNYPEYWYFTPWKEIIYDFNPESMKEWKWLERVLLGNTYCTRNLLKLNFVIEENQIPRHAIFDKVVTQYKVVDEKGNIVFIKPYIEKYLTQKEVNNEKSNKQKQYYPPMRYYFRHPQTTNEKRQFPTKEDREIWKEYGLRIKHRQKRNPSNLADLYDDTYIHTDKCWKSHTKQSRQYLRNLKGKRKSVHGELLRNYER